jgi:tetratricopeptide (TPR) repeat protein
MPPIGSDGLPVSALLAQAVALHRQGNLAAAEEIYERILRRRPDDFDALHFLGVAALQTGRAERGVDLIRRAIAQYAGDAPAYNNLAEGLKALHRLDEALAAYDRAIAFDPAYAEAHCNRGTALRSAGRPDEAIVSYDRAIALRPDYAEAHFNRANALADLGRHDEAVASYDRAITVRPAYAEAHANRGSALEALGRYEDAIDSCDRAIALRPNDAVPHLTRGIALHHARQPGAALASYEQAIAMRPDYAEAHCNRAVALQDLGRYDEAIAGYDRAAALRPDYGDAWRNRGLALQEVARFDEAMASFDRAIALHPDDADAHCNRGYLLLLLGRFEPGWREVEWRKKVRHPAGNRFSDRPLWTGRQDIAGRTLLLHAEQGFGDTIQFCRYATLVRERGARVVLSVPPVLVRLVATMDPAVTVLADDAAPEAFDYHCPLMSLPLALGTTLETIPAMPRYLHADERQRAHWQARLAALPGCRVGLVWTVGLRPAFPRLTVVDQRRSLPLTAFAPLATVGGVAFVSLQKGPAAAQTRTPPAGLALHDWTDELADFADTAALIDGLDLVISVDTSVAHLAGALGKPVWLLNRFDTCWRWLLERRDSPWYPSVRLFRQPAMGDWPAAIEQVRRELAMMVESDGLAARRPSR